jgi:uncharacterized protein YprB with RNaseH-like and TPR domain
MTAIHSPVRTGVLWQQRLSTLREYDIVRDGNVFGTALSPTAVLSSEFDAARRHLELLLARHQGMPISAVFRGRDEVNEGGTCCVMESTHDLAFRLANPDRFRSEAWSDLTLVHGIGLATQARLKAKGFGTIGDLIRHPRYRTGAESVLDCLMRGCTLEIMDLIGSRHSRSHLPLLGVTGLHEPEDFVFLDIETLGLFSRPIILFGVGVIREAKLHLSQYLLRDIEEEQAALLATAGHLSGDRPVLVTFNGRSFDLPYFSDRLAYYGLGTPRDIPHFDMLHFSRRRWKGQYPSLRLTELEREILGIHRTDDIPGQMVPEFYEAYQRSGNCGPLVPIVEHNQQDVVSLARLFFLLAGEAHGSP